MSFFFSEHDNAIFWKLELVDEEIPHALGIIDATLELMPRVLIRDPADHRLLPPVRVGGRAWRRVRVRSGRWRRVRIWSGRWRRVGGWRLREAAWVGD